MRWFVLRLFADHSFSPDHLAKAIIVIRPETFIASGQPSLLAVSNCRSSCSQVLSAFFLSSWERALSLTTCFGLAKCASGFSTLSFIFDVLAIGFLFAGDHTTTTFWRDLEFLQNCGHRQLARA